MIRYNRNDVRYIGYDECGKGEIFGDMILCGAELSDDNYEQARSLLKTADTKRRKTASAWNLLGESLDDIKVKKWVARIKPSDVMKGETARVMDSSYIDLIKQSKPDDATRITVDDYGIGRRFKSYLDGLNCEVKVEHGADNNYVEVRTASVVAKVVHATMMSNICENVDYVVRGFLPGSGNCGDHNTKRWLCEWCNSGKPWPSFVKTWWSPVRKLEAKKQIVRLS